MTNKQLNSEKRTAKEAVLDVRITLEYSIKLLEDYKGDQRPRFMTLVKL